MALLEPKDGVATNSLGKTFTVSANSASKDLDCKKIQQIAVSAQTDIGKSLKNIGTKLRNIDAGKNVLSVEDKSLEPLIEAIAEEVEKNIPTSIDAFFEEISTTAEKSYNQIQEAYNTQAQEEAERQAAASEI